MKNPIKGILSIISFIVILAACENQDQAVEPTIDAGKYEALSNTLNKDFNEIASVLRSSESKFNDSRAVVNSAKSYYGESSESYQAFLANYNQQANARELNTTALENLSVTQRAIVEEILLSVHTTSSLYEYEQYLQQKFDEVLVSSELENTEKDLVLSFITTYKASLNFLKENYDIIGQDYNSNGRMLGWWEDWGKCAAGTLGGAGLGTLAGAAAGSAVPVIGTTAGGIVGGISGALSGAAASC